MSNNHETSIPYGPFDVTFTHQPNSGHFFRIGISKELTDCVDPRGVAWGASDNPVVTRKMGLATAELLCTRSALQDDIEEIAEENLDATEDEAESEDGGEEEEEEMAENDFAFNSLPAIDETTSLKLAEWAKTQLASKIWTAEGETLLPEEAESLQSLIDYYEDNFTSPVADEDAAEEESDEELETKDAFEEMSEHLGASIHQSVSDDNESEATFAFASLP